MIAFCRKGLSKEEDGLFGEEGTEQINRVRDPVENLGREDKSELEK